MHPPIERREIAAPAEELHAVVQPELLDARLERGTLVAIPGNQEPYPRQLWPRECHAPDQRLEVLDRNQPADVADDHFVRGHRGSRSKTGRSLFQREQRAQLQSERDDDDLSGRRDREPPRDVVPLSNGDGDDAIRDPRQHAFDRTHGGAAERPEVPLEHMTVKRVNDRTPSRPARRNIVDQGGDPPERSGLCGVRMNDVRRPTPDQPDHSRQRQGVVKEADPPAELRHMDCWQGAGAGEILETGLLGAD